jgi:hypothetical protein
VRFEQRLRDGIHSGAIVLAFRRWRRSQVAPGRRYRTGIDMVEVESVDVVEPSSVDAAQAREAGYASVGVLLADLRGDPALPVYRIRLRRIDGPDPRDELARAAGLTDADVAAITARLAGMDRSSSRGPWTGAVLALIAGRPGIVSAVLADPQPRRRLPVVTARRVVPEPPADPVSGMSALTGSRPGIGSGLKEA